MSMVFATGYAAVTAIVCLLLCSAARAELRAFPYGRIEFAAAFLLCLVAVVVWPIVLPAWLVLHAQSKRKRQSPR